MESAGQAKQAPWECIWEGPLAWSEKTRSPKTPSDKKTTRTMRFKVFCSKNVRQGINPESWPKQLIMQLIAKQALVFLGSEFSRECVRVIFRPEHCPVPEALFKVTLREMAGCVHFQTPRNSPCHIKVLILFSNEERGAYVGFIPNDQAGFVERIRHMIQQQKINLALSSGHVLPNEPQLHRTGQVGQKQMQQQVTLAAQTVGATRPQVQQDVPQVGPTAPANVAVAPQQSVEPRVDGSSVQTQHIWQGSLEWFPMGMCPDETSATLRCEVVGAQTDCPALKGESWPEKLVAQMVPKEVVGALKSDFLRESVSVLFRFQDGPALEVLSKAMSEGVPRVLTQGLAGFVYFVTPPGSPCHVKVLILWFSEERGAYVGFIPNDQAGCAERIVRLVEDGIVCEHTMSLLAFLDPRNAS